MADNHGRRPNLEPALLQASLDCIIAIDHQGLIIEFNPAAEQTFGWRRQDVIGRELAEVVIPPALREPHRQGLATYLTSGRGPVLDRRVEMVAMRADGSEFPVELTVTRVPGAGPAVFTGSVRDISARKRTERRRATELAITRVLALSATANEAMLGILRAVSESMMWDAGALWTLEDPAEGLRCADFWSSPMAPAGAFEAETRQRTFAPGIGLPGRVWSSAQSVWIADVAKDSTFLRGPVAAADNLHSGFAFPVLRRGEVIGVAEFFGQHIEQPDDDLVAMVSTIGSLIGQFLERTRSQAALREADRRKDGFLATLAHELRNPLAPISHVLAVRDESAERASLRHHRIVVVDDNQDSAESLGLLLERMGHEVRRAHDGASAMSLARTYRPDIVLLDIGLPDMSGLDVARSIRALPHGDGMLLVAVTGWGQDEDRRRSAEAGFDQHLVKPLDRAALESLLAKGSRHVPSR